jgi:hypothetical protein
MSDDYDSGGLLRKYFWALGPAAIVAGYFAQPALRWMNPEAELDIGLMLGVAILLFDRAYHHSNLWRHWSLRGASLFTFLVAAGLFAWHGRVARKAAEDNQIRCSHIQQHMLVGASGRADDAAMFQALGCQPQGHDDVQWHDVPPPVLAPSTLSKLAASTHR